MGGEWGGSELGGLVEEEGGVIGIWGDRDLGGSVDVEEEGRGVEGGIGITGLGRRLELEESVSTLDS